MIDMIIGLIDKFVQDAEFRSFVLLIALIISSAKKARLKSDLEVAKEKLSRVRMDADS